MPIYTYRREDGTEFDIRQKFSDDPLTIDPETGQSVVRIVQPAGIVFKGSGFYINDSRGSKSNLNGSSDKSETTNKESDNSKSETAPAKEAPASKKESA